MIGGESSSGDKQALTTEEAKEMPNDNHVNARRIVYGNWMVVVKNHR